MMITMRQRKMMITRNCKIMMMKMHKMKRVMTNLLKMRMLKRKTMIMRSGR